MQVDSMFHQDFITVVLLVLLVIMIFIIWRGLIRRDDMARTTRSISRYRSDLYAKESDELTEEDSLRKKSSPGIDRLRNKFKMLTVKRFDEIHRTLCMAGWRSRDAVVYYLVAKYIFPIIIGAVGFVVAPQVVGGGVGVGFLGLAFGAFLGFAMVDGTVQRRIRLRQKSILRGLPDLLDLLVICTEAGLTLQVGFDRVAKEIVHSHPALAEEVHMLVVEMNFHQRVETALDNFALRTDLQPIRSLVSVLQHSMKFGSPISQSLATLAEEFRTERLLKAEELAGKLPAMLTIPLILFILPVLFIILLTPAIIQVIDSLASKN